MAGSSLLALIDDIATILQDVAVMTKVATKKTAGVLGDDLALNAEQVVGVDPDRELPVVWAVAKGSALNKLILVPCALAINALAPWMVTPLLMLGGAFLCFEGFEKVAHKLFHKKEEDHAEHVALVKAVATPSVDMVAFEKDKIRGAIRTDFILSAEIIVITLGTVATAPFSKQVTVLAVIAVLMTIGVYGLVGGIVKMDDLALILSKRRRKTPRAIGRAILWFAPYLMKTLSIAGTVAMFLVGGGILTHGIPGAHDLIAAIEAHAGPLEVIASTLADLVAGVLVGAVCVALFTGVKRLRMRLTQRARAK